MFYFLKLPPGICFRIFYWSLIFFTAKGLDKVYRAALCFSDPELKFALRVYTLNNYAKWSLVPSRKQRNKRANTMRKQRSLTNSVRPIIK